MFSTYNLIDRQNSYVMYDIFILNSYINLNFIQSQIKYNLTLICVPHRKTMYSQICQFGHLY